MSGRDNLEHGWLVGREQIEECRQEKQAVGVCAWCGEDIYEDEDFYTYGYNEAGELLCIDCLEESKERGVA